MTVGAAGPTGPGPPGALDLAALLLRGPVEVAPRLLGCRLARGEVVVRLTEVEAYAGDGTDAGSHAHRGLTPRNAAMFGPPGRAYVYFVYGMHWCLNVVVGPPGRAHAVLVRAGEVVGGAALARARRPGARSDRDLARGPARLAATLDVDGVLDGVDLLDPRSPLRLEPPAPDTQVPAAAIRSGPRVGLRQAAKRPWRFWVDGDPTVSPYRAAGPRRGQ
jgi:DNA-3-methyladenine glycosylase